MKEIMNRIDIGLCPIGSAEDKGDVRYISRESMDKAIWAAYHVAERGRNQDARKAVENGDPWGFLGDLRDGLRESDYVSPVFEDGECVGYDVKKNDYSSDRDEQAVIAASWLLNGRILGEIVG